MIVRLLQFILILCLLEGSCFAQADPAVEPDSVTAATPFNRNEVVQQISRLRAAARDGATRLQAEKDAATLLSKLAETNVSTGHSGLALQDLAETHPNFWGDEVVLLVFRKISEHLRKEIELAEEREINTAIQQPLVMRMLTTIESRSPEVRELRGLLYVRAFLAEIATANNFERAVALHGAFRERLPQDDSFQEVMLLRADRAVAKKVVRKLEKLSPINWGVIAYWAVILLLVAVVLFLLRLVKQILKKGSSRRGYQSLINEPDEYARLLAAFGLNEGASEDSIRAAYRNLMKSFHPDSRRMAGQEPLSEDEANEKFLELKRNHDRLLEMRKSFFR